MAKFQEMTLKDFFSILSSGGNFFGEGDQFGQFWWMAFGKNLCDIILKFGQVV